MASPDFHVGFLPGSQWVGIGLAVGVIAALTPIVGGHVNVTQLRQVMSRVDPVTAPKNPFEGLDLNRLELHPRGVRTTLPNGNIAELSLDSEVQRTAVSLMRRSQIPEAGVVLLTQVNRSTSMREPRLRRPAFLKWLPARRWSKRRA
jgi:hypothetical protein